MERHSESEGCIDDVDKRQLNVNENDGDERAVER